jgi:exodeoxyribonuclease VII large subunit
MIQILRKYRTDLSHFRKVFKEPKKRIEEYFLRADDLINRIRLSASWVLRRRGEKCLHLSESLLVRNPMQRVKNLRLFVSEAKRRSGQSTRYSIEMKRQKVSGLLGKLDSLSPLSILQRGYSITRKLPTLQILRDTAHVNEGDKVEVKLFRGILVCGVEKTGKA